MRIDQHVLHSLHDCDRQDYDSALLHASFAIEGTAKNLFHKGGRQAYKDCLRQYYWLIEIMIGGVIDLKTTFNNVVIKVGSRKVLPKPDLADVIYHIFRCNHAHAEEIPLNYSLLPLEDGNPIWIIGSDTLQMPILIIFALLSVSVFAKCNNKIQTEGIEYLIYGNAELGNFKFLIKDFWGKEDDFRAIVTAKYPKPIVVKIEGLF